MERIMVTLSEALLAEVDAMARQAGKKRSEVVREALHEWLARRTQGEFEALLAEGYQALSEQATLVVAESLPGQAAAAEGLWRWDE